MITTATADSALKTYYLPALTDQLNKSISPLLSRFRLTTADIAGKDIKKLVRHGINGGIGAGSETGDLPTPANNRYALFTGTLKNLYGTIEISDKAIRASATNDGAFVSLLNDEMKGILDSATFNFGRMLFGDGSGKLATIKSADGGVYHVDSVRNLAEGMLVNVYNAGGSIAATARSVEKVDYETKSITLSGANISSPTDYVLTLQGSRDYELTGLGAIFKDSGTIYGLSRDSNPWLKPTIKTEVGRSPR